MKLINENSEEFDTCHYDIILELYADTNEDVMDHITEAINNKKYKISLKSISRINNYARRYEIADMFEKFINNGVK
jgi:hypothetical protein